MTVTINDQNFKEITAKGAVIVDFWAEWCPPCKMQGPVFEEVSNLYEGKCVFAKMDVDSSESTPRGLGIMNIPTLMIFKDGKQVAKNVGMLNKAQLINFIDKSI